MTSTYAPAEQFRSMVLWIMKEKDLRQLVLRIKKLSTEDPLLRLALELAISRARSCEDCHLIYMNFEQEFSKLHEFKIILFKKWTGFSQSALQNAKSKEEVMQISGLCPPEMCKAVTDKLLLDFPLGRADLDYLREHSPWLVLHRLNLVLSA